MVKLFRHRHAKAADTDKPYLSPPRHIPTLPDSVIVGASITSPLITR